MVRLLQILILTKFYARLTRSLKFLLNTTRNSDIPIVNGDFETGDTTGWFVNHGGELIWKFNRRRCLYWMVRRINWVKSWIRWSIDIITKYQCIHSEFHHLWGQTQISQKKKKKKKKYQKWMFIVVHVTAETMVEREVVNHVVITKMSLFISVFHINSMCSYTFGCCSYYNNTE